MPKIMIVEVETNYDYEGSYNRSYITDRITDWEEITDHELEILKKYLPMYNAHNEKNGNPNVHYSIIVKPDKGFKEVYGTILGFVKKQKEETENGEKIRKEDLERKRQKQEKKQKEKDLKLFEELKKKFGQT